MKKIILGIFTMLSILTFSESNLSGPKIYVGGGIGLGTHYHFDLFGGFTMQMTSLGLDLDANFGPTWTYKIDEESSIDFGPSLSLTLRNHVVYNKYHTLYNIDNYYGNIMLKANMGFDYNFKIDNKDLIVYMGLKIGGGAYNFWGNSRLGYILGTVDVDTHAGIKLQNGSLRIGGSLGTRGLIFEAGKLF